MYAVIFSTKESYVVNFNNPETIYHENGLGYIPRDGTPPPYSADQDFMYHMRYTNEEVNKFVIPYEDNLIRLGKDHDSPCRLNGSVGDTQAKFYTPEWYIDGYAKIKSREIYKIYADGTDELVALYDSGKGRFFILEECYD